MLALNSCRTSVATSPRCICPQIAFLRSRQRGLVPRMPLVHGIAERIGLDECLAVLPVVIKGTAKKNANAEVDVHRGRS